MRALAVCVAVAGLGAALVACTPPKLVQPPEPDSPHLYTLRQERSPGAARFVACRDCDRPTPKTLARVEQRHTVAKAISQQPTEPPSGLQAKADPQAQKPPSTRTETAILLFESGSSRLSAEALSRLTEMAPLLNKATRIRVTGFTDSQGSQGVNQRLAMERTREALDRIRALTANAESPPALSGVGKPMCCYLADNTREATRAPNRRAELTLELPDTADVAKALGAAHAGPRPSKAPQQQAQPADIVSERAQEAGTQ